MRYHLVIRVMEPAGAIPTLTLDVEEFALPPVVGDVVFWDSGWGGLTVEYRYVGRDFVELGCGRVNPSEVKDFVAAGWRLR